MTRASFPARSTALRCVSAALAVLFFAGQSAAAMHFALVAHRVCAEHGDLVHADEHAGEGHGAQNDHAEESADLGGADRDAHEHDTCAVVAIGDPAWTTPSGSTIAVELPNDGQTITAERSGALGHSVLYARAPKTSPPADPTART